MIRSIYVGKEEIYFNSKGVVNDPFEDLDTGSIVEYKSNNYFFRPNGSIAYLFTNLKDFKMCRNDKCIHRPKLTNCNFYVCDDSIDLKSETDSESSDHEEKETWESILRTREIIYTAEELYNMQRRHSPAS